MIKFGTAGLRGLMQPGEDGLNDYTVALATLGISRYLKQTCGKGKIIFAYDTRHHSREYAYLAAGILQKEGHQALIFPYYAPTPILAYSIRPLHADLGIVLTASHNPKEYNGYKVYGSDGIQINEATAAQIASNMEEEKYNTAYFINSACLPNLSAELPAPETITPAIVPSYIHDIQSLWQRKMNEEETCKMAAAQHNLKIVYTPVHGTGAAYFLPLLQHSSFADIIIVKEQAEPDPDFPTAPKPNPEYPEVLLPAIKQAEAVNADIVLVTDPDADRCALALPDTAGEWHQLSGNETGALLSAILIDNARSCQRRLNSDDYLVKSVVTDDFGAAIAKANGLSVCESLTGFKNICGTIPKLRTQGKRYFFGYEESVGYSYPDFVRDKDGLASCYLLAMAAAYVSTNGCTLWQYFNDLQKRYGYYVSAPFNIVNTASDGNEQIQKTVNEFRTNSPLLLAGGKLLQISDYLDGSIKIFAQDGTSVQQKDVLKLPKQNLVKFFYDNNLTLSVRPSGTEPKLKFYLDACASTRETAVELLQKAGNEIRNLLKQQK